MPLFDVVGELLLTQRRFFADEQVIQIVPVGDHLLLLETELIGKIRTELEGVFCLFGFCQRQNIGRTFFKYCNHLIAVVEFCAHDLTEESTGIFVEFLSGAETVVQSCEQQQMTDVSDQCSQAANTPAFIAFGTEFLNSEVEFCNDVLADVRSQSAFFRSFAESTQRLPWKSRMSLKAASPLTLKM